MALSFEEIQDLRAQGKYRETIAAVVEWAQENPEVPGTPEERGPFFLERAWAHYQLGEYEEARTCAMPIIGFLSVKTETGESAQCLLAHCAERQAQLKEAMDCFRAIPPSRARDNLYITVLAARMRQGEEIDAIEAMHLATDAMMRAPYETVDAHIVNNVAWLFHQMRDQEDVRELLPILPGLIEMAVGMYEATGAAQNHLAGALYQASLIFGAADWKEGALVVIRGSIAKWQNLVKSQGGERYRQNLQGAQEQLAKLKRSH